MTDIPDRIRRLIAEHIKPRNPDEAERRRAYLKGMAPVGLDKRAWDIEVDRQMPHG